MSRAKKAVAKSEGFAAAPPDVKTFSTEFVPLADLKPHPKNYKAHPDDQLAHIEASLRRDGPTKNVVVARDNTILAGHGVVQAALRVGYEVFPVRRLAIDPEDPRALAVLAGDNEISNLAAPDDRMLTELLKGIMESDVGLLGTGFDEQQLAALALVTRPASEIGTIDEAAAWVGMPEFSAGKATWNVVFVCENEKDRDSLIRKTGVRVVSHKNGKTWSYRWPPQGRQDLGAARVVAAGRQRKKATASR